MKCSWRQNINLERFSRVVDEVVTHIKQFGRSDFFFTDLDLNGDYQRTLHLSEELQSRAPGIRFHCWLRAHELDHGILKALYDSGMRSYFVGIEAVNDNLLALIRKGYSADHAKAVLRIMSEFADAHEDIRYGFNLIPHYPGETLDDVVDTFAAISKDRSHYVGRTAALYEFALTVNTIIWLQKEKLGLRNLFGWNQVLLPPAFAESLPSHRYWYDDPERTTLHRRRLLWDYARILVGHEPLYTSAERNTSW